MRLSAFLSQSIYVCLFVCPRDLLVPAAADWLYHTRTPIDRVSRNAFLTVLCACHAIYASMNHNVSPVKRLSPCLWFCYYTGTAALAASPPGYILTTSWLYWPTRYTALPHPSTSVNTSQLTWSPFFLHDITTQTDNQHSFVDHAFHCTGHSVWNSMNSYIVDSSSLAVFKSKLWSMTLLGVGPSSA